jgi:glycosyltransferase involved in cell wall biosynthesis
MSDPVAFTVVVPTRERADVLSACLETIVAQDYEPLSILVSDNCSQDATRDIVAALGDPRVRYLRTERRLNMSDNWEFALGQVDGGWVTVLGDDDGLLPGALARAATIIRETGARAMRSGVCAYTWPSLAGTTHGRIRIPRGHRLRVRESRHWIDRVMAARASYLELPMLYNGGFVDFDVLTAIREKTGRFYRSSSPDLYMALAIASVLDRYVYIEAPLAVNGASAHSTGTANFSAGKRASGSPASRFLSELNMPFHADLPLMPDGHYPSSFQVLVYESWLQTQDLREPTGLPPHARQLELILATAGRYRGEMEEWGRRFATTHGLDFDAARRHADRTRRLRRLRGWWRKLERKFSVHKAGSADLPLADVAEASRYASGYVYGEAN